jgi:hypothetical protein
MGIAKRITEGTLGEPMADPADWALILPTPNAWPSFIETIFVGTDAVSISNSLVEASLLGSGLGSVSIPGKSLTAGSSIVFEFAGRYTTDANDVSSEFSLSIKAKNGGTYVLATAGAIDLPRSDGASWFLRGSITIKTTGSPGTAIVSGIWTIVQEDDFAPVVGIGLNQAADVSIETGESWELDLAGTWTEASSSNSFTLTAGRVGVIPQ